MVKRQMKFTLPTELITEPLVYNLSQEFGLMANVQRANFNMTDNRGWVVLELDGSDEDIQRGLEWVTGKGVEVEAVEAGVP